MSNIKAKNLSNNISNIFAQGIGPDLNQFCLDIEPTC